MPEGDRALARETARRRDDGQARQRVDGRKYLADLPAMTIEQRVQVRQAEAQLLRDANDNDAAYAVLMQR